jgi:hypothetical protein
MKFAVVALGSTGDLYPFLAIASALARRGHDVTLLGQAPYESQVLAEGVGFRAVVGSAEHHRTLEHPLLWHPLHGFGVLWHHRRASGEPTCLALGELARSGERRAIDGAGDPIAAGAGLPAIAGRADPALVRLHRTLALRHTSDRCSSVLGSTALDARGSGLFWTLLDRWKPSPWLVPC